MYSMTKAGLHGMTRTLALELGRSGITVNAVGPGPIATELFTRANPPDAPATRRILESIPVGRMGTPDDVAHAVAPLTDVDVAELVRSVRAAPRLLGQGDLPPLDVAALEDVLARVAVLAEDTPALHALELYPVVVGERGAAVLAARVELAEAERADGTRRALPE